MFNINLLDKQLSDFPNIHVALRFHFWQIKTKNIYKEYLNPKLALNVLTICEELTATLQRILVQFKLNWWGGDVFGNP